MTDVRLSYLVCATQRSGSTLMCELLKATGVAGVPLEYFEAMRDTGIPPHPGDFLEGLPPTRLGIREDPRPPEAPPYSSLVGLTDYREHLERTLAQGTTSNGVFGAKLMFNQLDELHALASDLPEFSGLEVGALLDQLLGGPRYIWVSRRDVARQAVSMWKAIQTRTWREGDGDESVTPQYRFDAIDHLVRRFQDDERGWERFFSRHGVEPLRIAYEDELVADRDGTIRRALDWLGVSPPPGWHAEEPLRRQADTDSDDWVAAYHRDRDAAQHPVSQFA